MAKISEKSRGAIRDEINRRKAADERPIPTVESIVDEMVRDRISKKSKCDRKTHE